MYQHFFNISPSSTVFVTHSHLPSSAFTFKLKISSSSDFLCYEPCTPSVNLRARLSYDFSSSSSSIFWKYLTKITQQTQQVLCIVSDPFSDLPWPLCQVTLPPHCSFPRQQSTSPILFPPSFFLICNHLTLHLHNWHLSFRSWTALNSCAAPEPSVELLPAATAACLSFLALFFIKTHNSNNATKTKLCSRQALWSSSSFNSASGHLEPLLPSPSPLCIFPLTASSAVLFSTSFTRGKSHHVSNTQQKQS